MKTENTAVEYRVERTLVGIDPGIQGGIAWQRPGEKACCVKMPDTEGDLIRLIRELNTVTEYIADRDGCDRLSVTREDAAVFYLEDLVKSTGSPMPGSAMAVYGSNWGFIKGAIQMAGCELHLVGAKKWQKALSMGARGTMSKTEWKNKLKAEAQRRYPHLNITLATADALLILAYATETKNQSALSACGVEVEE